MARLQTGLRRLRQRSELTQQALAGLAGISRQTLNALEMGHALPSTLVALQLSRALGCRVEEIFWLSAEGSELTVEMPSPPTVRGKARAKPGARLALASVGGRWIGHRLEQEDPLALTAGADALLTRAEGKKGGARVRLLANEESLRNNLFLCGCDPALGILAARVAQRSSSLGFRPRWLPASSGAALQTLARGHAHLAGAHLFDEESREFNVPFVRRAFAGRPMLVVTFAQIEEGFALPKGNPRGIRKPEDLARPGVRLINRESGAGARRLLDRLLAKAKIPSSAVKGYQALARGHLEAAQQIALGAADVGVVARSAALAYGLDFVQLAEERFDLVIPKESSADPRVARVLEALESKEFRRELGAVGGYDASKAGHLVAELRA